MYAIDTQERLDWFLNALENNEIQFVSRERSEEEWEEMRREIAEYKAMRQKSKISKELVFV